MIEQPAGNSNQQNRIEALRAFREEIQAIYDAEQREGAKTKHFVNHLNPEQDFYLSILDMDDLAFWKRFKKCESGEKSSHDCISDLREYEEGLTSPKSLAHIGLISYLVNRLQEVISKEQKEMVARLKGGSGKKP